MIYKINNLKEASYFFEDFFDSAMMAFIVCFETICVSVLKPAEPCRLLVRSVLV